MAVDYEELAQNLRQLRLSRVAEILDIHTRTAAEKNLSHLEFLNNLISDVIIHKHDKYVQNRVSKAKFPFIKTVNDFEFEFQPSIPMAQIRELAALRFLSRHENLCFLGPPGVGKTHLAVSLGVAACEAGYKVLFTTTEDLLIGLRGASGNQIMVSRLADYLQPHLLIIDDFGIQPLCRNDAHAFFTLVSKRYEKNSTIITSNKSFLEWGDIMAGDSVVASATLDRLLHYAQIFNIKGESYRLKDRGNLFKHQETNISDQYKGKQDN